MGDRVKVGLAWVGLLGGLGGCCQAAARESRLSVLGRLRVGRRMGAFDPMRLVGGAGKPPCSVETH